MKFIASLILFNFQEQRFLEHMEECRKWHDATCSKILKTYRDGYRYADEKFCPSQIAKLDLDSMAKAFVASVIRALEYGMDGRHANIPKAHRETFEWMFRDSISGVC